MQLAKHFGAHVTAVCGTDHVELVRSLGADEVVDYRQQDFTKNGQTYDAIIDAVGKYSFRRGRRSLKPGGIYVATDGGRFLLETVALLVATRFVGSKRVRSGIGRRSKQDVLLLKELIEAGEFRAVIDRRYPMDGGGRGAPVRRDVAQGGQCRPDDRARGSVRRRRDYPSAAAARTFAVSPPTSSQIFTCLLSRMNRPPMITVITATTIG